MLHSARPLTSACLESIFSVLLKASHACVYFSHSIRHRPIKWYISAASAGGVAWGWELGIEEWFQGFCMDVGDGVGRWRIARVSVVEFHEVLV